MRLLALLVILAGCSAAWAASTYNASFGDFTVYTQEISTGRGNAWFTRIDDAKTGNTCYVYGLGSSMSCVPKAK